MTIDCISKVVETIHPGSFFRINYVTELPLKAKFKNNDWHIIKEVSVTSRTGIRYAKINGVVFSDASKKVSNFRWYIKNYISYNTSTGKYYLNIYPIGWGSNMKIRYKICHGNQEVATCTELTDDFKEYVIPSHFNKNGSSSTKIMKININNIISINNHYFF